MNSQSNPHTGTLGLRYPEIITDGGLRVGEKEKTSKVENFGQMLVGVMTVAELLATRSIEKSSDDQLVDEKTQDRNLL